MSAIRAAAVAAARMSGGRGPGLASLLPPRASALSSTDLAFAAARLVSGDLETGQRAFHGGAKADAGEPKVAEERAATGGAETGAAASDGASAPAGAAPAASGASSAASSPPAAPGLAPPSSSPSSPAAPGSIDFAGRDKNLVMVFTCSKCETRSAKAFSRRSYEQGVVIVTCPGCGSRHLVADHLGWFGQKGNLAQFADEHGFAFREGTADGTMEITPDDIVGTNKA